MTTPQTYFERYEYKYWTDEASAERAVRFASAYVAPDNPTGRPGGHRQILSSLYLDTDDYEFHSRHRDSDPDRFKLRVRAYGDPPGETAYFELKRKVKAVIVKRRAGVPAGQMAELLDGRYADLPLVDRPAERKNLEQFLYQQGVMRAVPKALIRYEREAYASPEDGVRFTVDRLMAYQPVESATLTGDPNAWVRLDTERELGADVPRVLVEIKFSEAAPEWMQELVAETGLVREAYSKYVSAIEYEAYERYLGLDYGSVPALGA